MYAGFLQAAEHYGWLVDEDVYAKMVLSDVLPDQETRALVWSAGHQYAAILSHGPTSPDDEMVLLVNGEIVDFGDDYPAVLGILDAASEGVPADGAGGEAAEVYVPKG